MTLLNLVLNGVPDLPAAACHTTNVDPDLWFSTNQADAERATAICRRCPAIRDCLAWSLTHDEHGIWAGASRDQRQALLDRHTRKAVTA